jgi:hypothetical protein
LQLPPLRYCHSAIDAAFRFHYCRHYAAITLRCFASFADAAADDAAMPPFLFDLPLASFRCHCHAITLSLFSPLPLISLFSFGFRFSASITPFRYFSAILR